jgi:hypothetical protein
MRRSLGSHQLLLHLLSIELFAEVLIQHIVGGGIEMHLRLSLCIRQACRQMLQKLELTLGETSFEEQREDFFVYHACFCIP